MKMSHTSREEYLDLMRRRYAGRGREGKGKLIDEVCELLRVGRKQAIKLLNRSVGEARPRPGRPSLYGQGELEVLKHIWKAGEQPCGKRLKAMLPVWLPHYEAEVGKLPRKLQRSVQQMSAASIDRILASEKSELNKGRCGTKPGSLLKTQIPIHSGPWVVDRPGYLEADTVAHCGSSMAGEFIWSITLTDIAVGWTENRATWNKGSEGVLAQIRDIEQLLPFPLLGFDSDNGSEFLNGHLMRYFLGREKPIKFTRSRPYHKNDNAHVEQKNWTHVRQLLGYGRLEDASKLELINELYREDWSRFQNFFQPSMKLIRKEKTGSRTRRIYDEPRTPFERMKRIKRGINPKRLKSLGEEFRETNPYELRRRMERKLKQILR
jgi:hypothetical protein